MTRDDERVAVLLMAYGSPRTPDEIEPYYTDIRRGRAPSAEQLADLVGRYARIGGTSPLLARTEAQRLALQRCLDELEPGRFEVVLGLKHAEPTIEAAIDELAARGHHRIVALVLAPHFSSGSVGEYHERARRAAQRHGLAITTIDSWATEPALVAFLAAEVRRSIAALGADGAGTDRVRVVFTAHSLPQRLADAGDPYPRELRSSAQAVAAAAGLDDGAWTTAWQSAARTPEPWLGPDIVEVLDELAASGEVDGVVVCACGFVSDHLEVRYDLDVVAAEHAAQRGLVLARTACVNDDPGVMRALAERVAVAAAAGP